MLGLVALAGCIVVDIDDANDGGTPPDGRSPGPTASTGATGRTGTTADTGTEGVPSACPEPIANRWPAYGDEGPPAVAEDAIGWGEGLVPPDVRLVDQFGDEVCLWQLVDHFVVLDAVALWNEPNKEIARSVACTQQAYGDSLVWVTLVTEANGAGIPAGTEDVEQWSATFGLGDGSQTPVLLDAGGAYADEWPGSSELPHLVLLGQDLRLLEVHNDDGPIRARLDQETGLDSAACL